MFIFPHQIIICIALMSLIHIFAKIPEQSVMWNVCCSSQKWKITKFLLLPYHYAKNYIWYMNNCPATLEERWLLQVCLYSVDSRQERENVSDLAYNQPNSEFALSSVKFIVCSFFFTLSLWAISFFSPLMFSSTEKKSSKVLLLFLIEV